jgi:CubicO group peptidase (beta-lactamase class C family)
MTMGTDWDELSVPYSDPTNSEIAMDMAPDRYRFVLGAPVVMAPGQRWIYNGGATALLARIIAKGTGKPLHEFARVALFDPLGIGPTEWYTDQSGEAIAASGLRMTPRDLARIGLMTLKGGQWVIGASCRPNGSLARSRQWSMSTRSASTATTGIWANSRSPCQRGRGGTGRGSSASGVRSAMAASGFLCFPALIWPWQ